MADADAAQVAPEVRERMDGVRVRNGLVAVQIILRAEYRPTQPWKEADFTRFTRLVEDIVARVTDVVGKGDEFRPNVESISPNPNRGSCLLVGRVSFIEELVKQPEIAACLDAYSTFSGPAPRS